MWSTISHIMSFPFWFFGMIFVVSALSNTTSFTYSDGSKRKATRPQRIGVLAIGVMKLSIATLLVSF